MQKKRRALAAPFVVTVVLSAGCEPVHTNPGPPVEPHRNPPPPTETATPTNPPAPTATPGPSGAPVASAAPSAAPIASAPAPSASASAAALPDPPNDTGHLVKNPDGTCLWAYPRVAMTCPPGAHCNPGPPREPLHVKCPSGPSAKP